MIISITLIFLFLFFLLVAWLLRAAHGRRVPVYIFPMDFSLKAEDVSFASEDGVKISGWFISAAQPSDKTIIILHGFEMNKGSMLKRTHYLAGKFNLLYFDFRGAGASGGESTIGLEEWRDAVAAVKFLKETRAAQAREIGLYGISMGSALAAYYAANYGGIKCLILESAYYSFKKVVKRWALHKLHIPAWPLTDLYLFFKGRRKGNLERFAPGTTSLKITAPTLMIHGELDNLAPVEDAKKVYAQISAPKELWIVRGAHHGTCDTTGGQVYIQKIQDFYNANL